MGFIEAAGPGIAPDALFCEVRSMDCEVTPSGAVVAPDVADIRVTRDLVRARQLLKIEVRHHVIVGREKPSYLSST
jgi:hypothetical protein